jgi:hypothetical protein
MTPGLTMNTFGGDDIEQVCAEAQRIADSVGRAVGFKFNSVRCVAVPGGSAAKLAERQQLAQRSEMVVHSDDVGTAIVIEDVR